MWSNRSLPLATPAYPYPIGDIHLLTSSPLQSVLQGLLAVLDAWGGGNDPPNCTGYEGCNVSSTDRSPGTDAKVTAGKPGIVTVAIIVIKPFNSLPGFLDSSGMIARREALVMMLP